MTTVNETVSDEQTLRMVGQVKWFNNKAGYGFITISDGENSGKDIFIHYNTIRVTNSQYKYLVQGEYVEFTLVKPDQGPHELQATDVSGIKGGALMCETRRVNRLPEEGTSRPNGGFRRLRVPRDEETERPMRRKQNDKQNNVEGEYIQVARRHQPTKSSGKATVSLSAV